MRVSLYPHWCVYLSYDQFRLLKVITIILLSDNKNVPLQVEMEFDYLVLYKLNNSVIFTKNNPLSIIGWSIYNRSIFDIPFYK